MEDGISLNDFKDDLRYMKIIFDKLGLDMKSIVFPRNQYSESLINECKKSTISSFTPLGSTLSNNSLTSFTD